MTQTNKAEDSESDENFFIEAKEVPKNKTEKVKQNKDEEAKEKAKLDLMFIDVNYRIIIKENVKGNFDLNDIMEHDKKKKKKRFDESNLQQDFKV